jgi:TolB-like protein/DNA-binding winged helix-turn-helix (wHTH) protein/Flp pilus assembly protein TadD
MGPPVPAAPGSDDPPSSSRQIVAFGAFELDRQSGELRKHGLKTRLADQPFQILLLLLEKPGHVITRDDIRQRLWSRDTFVDFDAGLRSAVRKLRDALGDSAERPLFVETLPKRGYRFIAPVSAPADESDGPAVAAVPASSRAPRYWMTAALALAATVAILLVARAGGAWGVRATPAPSIKSIAVLPLANLTGDRGQDYFVDGMTEGLTTILAQIDGLKVISRVSAMQYRQTTKQLPLIGRELQVDAIVGGSVARSGDRLRISAQLIHVSSDRHVWAHQYEGDIRNVVALQDEIARAIAGAIGGGRPARPLRNPLGSRPVDPKAYDLYLKGLQAGARGNMAGWRNAIGYFESAIGVQPDFAMGHASLAQAHLQFLYGGPLSPRDVVPKAEASARRAIALDDTLALGHQVLGTILNNYHWRWEEGDREIQRAHALNRNAVEELAQDTSGLIRRGRFEEAIAKAERARQRDPLSFNATMAVASVLRAAGQHDRALAEFRKGLEINPKSSRAHFQIGVTFAFMERWADAVTQLEEALRESPDNQRMRAYLGYAEAMAGHHARARETLKALEVRARQQYVSSFGLALIHDALGEKEPAVSALQRAYEEHAVEFAQLRQYPAFRSIRGDPRYEAVMRGFQRSK